MHLKLRDQQVKMIMYTHMLLHTNLMVATNPKVIDTCTEKIKEFKHQIIKDSHQITSEGNERGRKKIYKNKSKIINKMAIYIDN